ncbi:hypothetical protein BS47DRAFT_963386 [Hydnum rufescens UP504]|uniref:Uncharacterized protein n=1 Tax=Hydnum rufescens UP504 TaxID=1448309 RepID=A0A9P6AY66_9AGAM|nr:hypothetical protein BS47DRAFT_963386 [Hydnum rufescens UP504]
MNTSTSQNASDEQGSSVDSWSVLPSGSYVPSQPTQPPIHPVAPGPPTEPEYPAPAQPLSPVYPPQSHQAHHSQHPQTASPGWSTGRQGAANRQPQQQYPPSQTQNFPSASGATSIAVPPQQQQQHRVTSRPVYGMSPPPPPGAYSSPHEMPTQGPPREALARHSPYPPASPHSYLSYPQAPYYSQHPPPPPSSQLPHHHQQQHLATGYTYHPVGAPPGEYRASQEMSIGEARTAPLGHERERDNVPSQSSSSYSSYPVPHGGQSHYSTMPTSQYYPSDPRDGHVATVSQNLTHQPHPPVQQLSYDPHAQYHIRNSAPSGTWSNGPVQAQQASFNYRAPQESSTLTYPAQSAVHVEAAGRPGSRPTFDTITRDKSSDDSCHLMSTIPYTCRRPPPSPPRSPRIAPSTPTST